MWGLLQEEILRKLMRSERKRQLYERIDLIKVDKGTICYTNVYSGIKNDILYPTESKSKNNLENSL